MKKLLALFTTLFYLITSSTLVHSFCAKAHLEDTLTEHSCCDEESKDCFDNCMSSFSDTVTPTYEFTKKSTNDVDFGLQVRVFKNTTLLNTQNYFLTEFVYDPPWQWNYVGVTKKVE